MKTFATLMMGAALLATTPAFAGNEIDIVQKGGGFNSASASQSGRDNDFAASQEGLFNDIEVAQKGRNNKVGAAQDGLFNEIDVIQEKRRRRR